MSSPFLPSSGSPRRCADCDAPVIVKADGTEIDDSARHRGRLHDDVCGRVVAPRKAASRSR